MVKSILQEGVYQELRRRITAGKIAPGATLREEHIAAELNVSRTPVREALRKLAEEGFAEYVPHKGARVLTPTPVLVREVFDIREALEGIAARQASAKADPVRLATLRAHFDSLRPRVEGGDLSDVGDSIHEEILRAGHNQRLEHLMSIYHSQVTWFQSVAAHVPGRLQRAFREHESILCALESRDPEWAESAVRAHIRTTLRELLDSIEPPLKKGQAAGT